MYKLPNLSYDYQALEPAISRDIMELHHAKHHQTYVDKLSQAIESHQVASGIEELLRQLDRLPESIRQAVRNHGGGHYNHSLFWQWMSPSGGGQPTGDLASAIDAKYGNFQGFVDEFSNAALGIFGSGWAWLMPDMSITTTPNQDNPIMSGGEVPLLGIDVWEHAYYLDYKNQRNTYIQAWWDVVDWQAIEIQHL